MKAVGLCSPREAGEILTRAAARLAGSPPESQEDLKNFFERFSLLREVFGGFMLILIGGSSSQGGRRGAD